MKLIIRKEDSSANILLFICGYYKRFNPEANKGLKLSFILSTMKLFNKNETAVRMALSRALKSGLFEKSRIDNEICYIPTDAGKLFIRIYEDGVSSFVKRLHLRNMGWDGKWSMLTIFYDPGIEPNDKTEIVKCLQRFGFTKMSADVWISPYDMSDEVKRIKELIKDKGASYLFRAESSAEADMKGFLENVLKTCNLKKSYMNFVNEYEGKLKNLNKTSEAYHPIESDIAVPLFYELGLNFFNFSLNDPLLPKDLIAEWDGEKAAALMMQLMEILMPSVKHYFETI